MKRNRLWSGILAAVVTAAMMSQTLLAQNVTAEMKAQEEVAAAEVKVTGIRTEGSTYNISWITRDVRASDVSVITNVVQGMDLMVSYSDGSEAKISDSINEWIEKGVKASVKEKDSGHEIPMDGNILPPGSYEAYLNYQGFSCKATDFTIKTIEDAVDATITTESNVAAYDKGSYPIRNTVTKFVADEPAYYTFRAVWEDRPDSNLAILLLNAKGEFVESSTHGTALTKFLEAGTYYLKVVSSPAFTVSVERKNMAVKGIKVSGSSWYGNWSVGDVNASDRSIMMKVVLGLEVLTVLEDGTEVVIKDSVIELLDAGVTVTLKNKDDGSLIALEHGLDLPAGNYEVFLNYQGFTCKARDFTIKEVKDAVDATITTKSDKVVYTMDSNGLKYQNTVTKFVADKPGFYTFRAVTEESADYYFSMELRNAENEYVASVRDTSLSKFLEAGTYYLKVPSTYTFTVSVEEKNLKVTGITVSGSAYYDTWSEGDVQADKAQIFFSVIQGLDVMQVMEDGTTIKIGDNPNQLIAAGVTVTLKNKDTGSTVDLDGNHIPAGSYEVVLHFQGYECKAMDFTIQKIEEAVTGSVNLKKNSVDYAADTNIKRNTVTKFVAESPGYYIFQVEAKGDFHDWIELKLYNENISYEKNQYTWEPFGVFLKAGTYYFKTVTGDAHTVSVSGKEVRSIKMEEPGETERLYLIDDVKSWGNVAGANEANVNSLYHRTKVELEYEDGSRETRSLNELLGAWGLLDWGECIWNIMTGEQGGSATDPLKTGIYKLQYWSDTSQTMTDENVDLDYNFIIYKGFQDVALTDWFVYPVAYASAAGMMTGMGDGTNFGPAENLSRAQFATILYRMEGSPNVAYREVFPDVKDKEFYTNAVLWANENNVVTGYADTQTFGPADHITREQMAVMMYRFAQYKGYDVSESTELDSFPDHKKVSEFAQKAMKWASATGLIRGDQGNINPQGNASRAQCATIMMRFSEKYL